MCAGIYLNCEELDQLTQDEVSAREDAIMAAICQWLFDTDRFHRPLDFGKLYNTKQSKARDEPEVAFGFLMIAHHHSLTFWLMRAAQKSAERSNKVIGGLAGAF